MQRSLTGRIYYGWIVVGVTALTLITSAGERSVPGVLIHPLEEEFGWSRAGISLAVSIGLLLFGFAGLWVKVTVQVTTQISPLLTLAGQMQGFGPMFFHNLFFRGPGKLFMDEYAKFIAGRNELLGSAGQLPAVRGHLGK